MFIKKVLATALASVALTTSVSVFSAEQALDLDALLKTLANGQTVQTAQNKQREADFIARQNEQAAMLSQAKAKRDGMIAQSQNLEGQFEKNEIELANATDLLSKRMGSLKELFGVLQQVSGDTKNKFATSIVSAELPGRGEFMDQLAQKMGSSSKLASIEDIETVWFELQREMTEQGKVKRFDTEVIVAGGNKVKQEVVRVGAFNLISNGKYLEYNSYTDTLSELSRQPVDRFLSTAAELQETKSGFVNFALDPTGGSILGLLVQAPDTTEQVHQGGTVGYVILAVGLVGLLISIERFIALFIIGGKMRRQLKSDVARDDNPLGRVMKVKDQFPNVAYDTLELKLSEAILREMPKITRNLTFIKIISVVAPLLGLLGTVTGMINTFQAITLFGTGDPKLMAGGISQALVTTVLGLVVAIPTVFVYTILNTRSKNLLLILQEQSAGIIAERSEKGA
ncbi:MotA/TolQ/ExbB proton channel family protein [Pseudoalteromonas tunicata]|jgi:biopolymer transport protein ExbB|uniref:Putative Tol protein n=1 Tax=Pseudoalteromonas tunicata D2 TaxID=87626 RepID=A4C3Z2_9GAMM|nr:MotA/TolQ/ExbB proton channel family protein [Pseudoalteromonas tunicata]ATC97242.1 biopolymer transport protein ExbB [Pseudoalteromonas tunicata]AXT33324.1 MotA/TolQ/ExbB proton channel family protein [Pseudoalteromonas tunicata]EAR30274.1 putative Tol protein [Pseudoalteromonas tunicata D2]MDP4984378.1 MotA/TolQ/ExbB proton channel family protein [Pseudoalteromonas tunicata]MDP5214420.1 MotA/TolQ/ExbB proton channel family protein [Pseudoalteromonas tunicata]